MTGVDTCPPERTESTRTSDGRAITLSSQESILESRWRHPNPFYLLVIAHMDLHSFPPRPFIPVLVLFVFIYLIIVLLRCRFLLGQKCEIRQTVIWPEGFRIDAFDGRTGEPEDFVRAGVAIEVAS